MIFVKISVIASYSYILAHYHDDDGFTDIPLLPDPLDIDDQLDAHPLPLAGALPKDDAVNPE